MEKYLKTYQYYVDMYDKHTVEQCRGAEKMFMETKSHPLIVEDSQVDMQSEMKSPFNKIYMWIKCGERYKNKMETIQKWMDRDKKKDIFVENTKTPEDITCLVCGRLMFATFSFLETSFDDDQDRMTFFYDCPLNHVPRRVFYHTGEEYKPKPSLCIKCDSVMKSTSDRLEKERKIVSTETCVNCGHVATHDFTLSEDKKDEIDLNYVEDRNRFCSDKDGREYVDYLSRMEGLAKIMERHQERENQKDVYEEISKIKKLKIIEIEQLLTSIVEKEKYIKFHFKDPEIHRDVTLSFVVHDAKVERTDRDSQKTLKKLIVKNLEDTNWRLIGDISYRLGMIEGRLKVYEKDEDLIKLIKPKNGDLRNIKL